MAQAKRVPRRDFVARIKGAKRVLLIPNSLPFRLYEMIWILPAAARHRMNSMPVSGADLKRFVRRFSQIYGCREGRKGRKKAREVRVRMISKIRVDRRNLRIKTLRDCRLLTTDCGLVLALPTSDLVPQPKSPATQPPSGPHSRLWPRLANEGLSFRVSIPE